MKKQNKISSYIFLLIGAAVLFLAFYIFVTMIPSILEPSGTLFAVDLKRHFITPFFFTLIFIYDVGISAGVIGFKPSKYIKPVFDFISRFRVILAILIALYTYNITVSTVYFTEDSIIVRSRTNPVGETYSHLDVVSIDTGINKKAFSNGHHFYYEILLIDGTRIEMANIGSYINYENYTSSTFYSHINQFDRSLQELDVPKFSNDFYLPIVDIYGGNDPAIYSILHRNPDYLVSERFGYYKNQSVTEPTVGLDY